MDFSFTEQQEMLRAMARDFGEKEFPKSLVRQMEKDERGIPEELWEKMAELGWMELIFPEEYGGLDASFLDLTVLMEEIGMTGRLSQEQEAIAPTQGQSHGR